jgi:hypothetical protein
MSPTTGRLETMNVFAVDSDPCAAARNLCDAHVRSKMIVESAQMLACAFRIDRLSRIDCPKTQKGLSRKHGYKNHPCTIWVRQTPSNFEWLVYHALEMNQERYYRWASSKTHFSIEFIEWCADNIDSALFEQKEKGLTKFSIAISEDKKCREIDGFDDLDRVEQYRLYYIHDKPFAEWTFRCKPSWY